MIFYYPGKKKDLLNKKDTDAPIKLHKHFPVKAMQRGKKVYVIDAFQLDPQNLPPQRTDFFVEGVPKAAICNMKPYLPPRPLLAAGGYVVRSRKKALEVLVIKRLGVWDLPKGKREGRETLAQCALREVREEVGIAQLKSLAYLDVTLHGIPRPDKGHFGVKTTHWYLMHTKEKHFTPQAEELIEDVAWMPWDEAKKALGYQTLRHHMQRIEAQVFSHFE